MIASLDELVAYTQTLGEALPELREAIVLRRPGCSQAAASLLAQRLPGIPHSYLTVARVINIDGVSIGYFQLSPSAYGGRDIAEKVIACNESAMNPLMKRHQKFGVYQVASWEADPICVAHAHGLFEMGQVVKYNIGNPTSEPIVLAEDFEQLLLLAGNLDSIRNKHSEIDDPTQALNEFKMCFTNILPTATSGMAYIWEAIAKVVLF